MYAQYKFLTTDKLERNLLSAVMTSFDFNGFEETSEALIGFIDSSLLSQDEVKSVLDEYGLAFIPFEYSTIEEVNWNASWEKNFSPIVIEDVCIRATFHEKSTSATEIIIDPKMSFGTGHHPTTELMIREMKNIDLKGKEILDFGSGTGILAIYASMLGAKHIDAIDNEEWAFENCIENCSLNNIQNVDPILGDSDYQFISTFAIILANVNRHVILQNLAKWHTLLDAKGGLLLSGLLDADELDILNKAIGFKHNFTKHLNGWILISLTKSN